jgi:general secretion pathway protein D
MMFMRKSRGLKGCMAIVVIALLAKTQLLMAAEYSPNFKNTEISEFINIVGKNLQKTIIVDPKVPIFSQRASSLWFCCG